MSYNEETINNEECEKTVYFEEVMVNNLDQLDQQDDNVDHLNDSIEKNTAESNDSSCYNTLKKERNEFPKFIISNQILTIIPTETKLLRRPSKLVKHHPVKKRKDLKIPPSISQQNIIEECELFGKIVEKKLSRLPYKCRELTMLNITKLVYKTCKEYKYKAR